MRMFEHKDVVLLLREEVKRAGSQDAFAKRTGVNRTAINKVLNGARLPSPSMIEVLGLAPIYVFKTDLPLRNLSRRR
jgi:transcriptional regulator with XRE-family HTH domain